MLHRTDRAEIGRNSCLQLLSILFQFSCSCLHACSISCALLVQGYVSSWLKKWRPEIKISVILIYFSLFLGTSQTALTFVLRNIPNYTSELKTYFLCESSGQLPGKVCERSFERLGWEIVIVIAYIILGCYPVVQLIYVVNVKDLKQELTREGSSVAVLNPLSTHKPRMQKTSMSSDTHV